MSRIGKKAIPLSKNVKVEISERRVRISSGKATLEQVLPEQISAQVEEGRLVVSRTAETRQVRALHGLTRSLLSNMVIGVERGFRRDLEIQGTGYRAQVAGSTLSLSLGFSKPVAFPIPGDVTIVVTDNTKIAVSGPDKQRVGQVAAEIRGLRPPEPYKGKGIRYAGEYVAKKVGKTV